MFGKNSVRKQDLTDGFELFVQSIFYTIQGEGPYAGQPAIFIRLAGCNLRCYFCDTEFESGMEKPMILSEILFKAARAAAEASFAPLIVLTGGEPLRQNIAPLVSLLLRTYPHVQIETAGTLWVPQLLPFILDKKASLVCSPKTPKVNPLVAAHCHDWKYIIAGVFGEPNGGLHADDGLPKRSTSIPGQYSLLFRPPRTTDRVWLQPCDEQDVSATNNNMKLAAKVAMKFGYRLCIQVHKVVGLE